MMQVEGSPTAALYLRSLPHSPFPTQAHRQPLTSPLRPDPREEARCLASEKDRKTEPPHAEHD